MKGRRNNVLNQMFNAELQKSSNKGGWTYVVWPTSVKFFGTRGLVKVRGKIDGHPFRSSFMAMGDGTHKLPVKAEIRQAIGKALGDTVKVVLETPKNIPVLHVTIMSNIIEAEGAPGRRRAAE